MRSDRPFLITVLTIFAVLCVSQACASRASASVAAGVLPGDYCNVAGVKRTPWTPEAKQRTRERVRDTLRALEVAPIIAAYHDAIVCRESFCGEASVVHALGQDSDGVREHGVGTHGLSLRWTASKWGDDAARAYCTPEASTVVAHEIIWRAVTRYGARNLVEVQAVYAGAAKCREGECTFDLPLRRRRGLCSRMRARGHDCATPLTRRHLGKRLAAADRREWAMARAREHIAGWLGRSSGATG
jgi:hypothetical protein